MDLEQFPTNETAQRMISFLTADFYKNSYVGKWLFQIMGEELEQARKIYEELPLQVFPETVTWGISYYEQMYGIPVNRSLSLEERRAEIIRRRYLRCPVNPAKLEELVRMITGTRVEVTENVSPYTFLVRLLLEDEDSPTDYEILRRMVRKVKPSHLSFLLDGAYSSAFQVKLEGSSRLQFQSGFYPRQNVPPLFLNGIWNLNGSYLLAGMRNGVWSDFYPVCLTWLAQVLAGAKSRQRLHGCSDYIQDVRSETKKVKICSASLAAGVPGGKVVNNMKTRVGVSFQSQITIEKDLWHLDGQEYLDGLRNLDADIFESEL